MNDPLRCLCFAGLLASSPIVVSAAQPAAVQAAEEKEKAALATVATQRDEKLAALQKWYTDSLEVIRKHGLEKGDLDLIVAAKAESERGTVASSPEDVEKLPPLLRGLRQQLDKATSAIAAWEQTTSQTATRACLADLEALEKQFTRAAQIDEAVQVRTARAAVAARLAGRPAEAAPAEPSAAPELKPDAPAPAAEPKLVAAPAGPKAKAVIPANSPDAYALHDLRKGAKISLQYATGSWKSWGRLPSSSPEDINPSVGDLCRLVISLPSEGGHAGRMLAMVPGGTKGHPFVFEVPQDFPELVLRINDKDDTYPGNPGTVEYDVEIVPPPQ